MPRLNAEDLFELNYLPPIPDHPGRIEQAIMKAEQEGFYIIRSTDATLLVDIDSDTDLKIFQKTFAILKPLYKLSEITRWRSKAKGWHIHLRCRPTSFSTRMGLQTMLGSDPIKEALSLKNYENGLVEPSVLFKPRNS
jgi:hypothetical protein